MSKVRSILISCCVVYLSLFNIHTAFAQKYYGERPSGLGCYGCLEIESDSTMKAYFIYDSQVVSTEKPYERIKYIRSGDTLFLSTENQWIKSYRFLKKNEGDSLYKECKTHGVPIVIKTYYDNDYMLVPGLDYLWASDRISYFDTTTNKVVYPISYVEGKAIIVLYDDYRYIRFVKEAISYMDSNRNQYRYLEITLTPPSGRNGFLCFDKFPLLQKGSMLYPIDSVANYDCWINNGFYFPIMALGQKDQEIIYPTADWEIGLMGLPGVSTFHLDKEGQKMPMLPKF